MMRILGKARDGVEADVVPSRGDDRPAASRPLPSIDLEVPPVVETATFALG